MASPSMSTATPIAPSPASAYDTSTKGYYTGLIAPTIHATTPPRAHGYGDIGLLRGALTQEMAHVDTLRALGATQRADRFYFPRSTFDHLGSTRDAWSFLWVLDHLETAFVGAYLAAAARLGALGHNDLALLALRVLEVECEHRTLGRVVAGDDPADNVAFEVDSFACGVDAAAALTPYLTGRGFPGGPIVTIAISTAAQIRAIA